MKARVSVALLLGLVAVGVASCGASGNGSPFDAPDGNAGGPGKLGGSSGSGTSSSGGFLGDGGGSTTGPLGDAACATEVHKSEASPLDLYIMQDRSPSMADNNKWQSVVQAIKSFVQSPQAAGIGVGLQYFPLPPDTSSADACLSKCSDCNCMTACGCASCTSSAGTGGNSAKCNAMNATTGSCDASTYAKPAVEIAPLPGVAGAIIASIDAELFGSGTPTRPAIDGAIQHARAYEQAHAGHKVVVVLATDGEPNDCSSTVDNVSQLAAAGVAGSPSILTFVIGVGGDLAGLNPVAAAGGTQQAILVDTGANATQQFLDALNKIRQLSVSCEYTIPTPSSGTIDYSKVNVEYTPSNGQPVVLGQVPDATKCDANAGGWYYDDAAHPTKIEVCSASCTAFNNGSIGVTEVNVAFGCDTVKQPLK